MMMKLRMNNDKLGEGVDRDRRDTEAAIIVRKVTRTMIAIDNAHSEDKVIIVRGIYDIREKKKDTK